MAQARKQAQKVAQLFFRPQPSSEGVPSLETHYVEEPDTDMNKCGGSGCGAFTGEGKGWIPSR